MKTKAKTFDCVRMMHEGAKRVQEETKGMSLEEELAYWNKAFEEMKKPRPRRRANAKKPR